MFSMKPSRRRAALRPLLPAACLAMAQAAGADNLSQVYEAARTHDAGLQSAVALLRAAEPRAAQAEALLRPSVNATSSGTRTQNNPPSSTFDPTGATTRTNASSIGLTVRQPLFNATAKADVAKARTGLEIARVDFETTSQDFIIRVAQAYFDVLAAQDVLTAARANRTSVAGQLAAASSHYDAGTGIITDVRDAQARHDLALSQEIAAENDLRTSRLTLSRLVGRPGVQPDPLAVPVTLPALAPTDPQAWTEAAQDHPDIRRSRLVLESAQIDVERARAGRLPTVDAVGSAAYARNTGSGTVVPGNNRNTSIGLEMNLPIFAGYATQNRIAEARLLEDKAREDLSFTRSNVAEATEKAFFELQSGQAQVKALEAAEVSSRASLDGTQTGFQAGVRLNIDVLNAQTLLFQTQRDLARARYGVLMGYLKLRRAAGQLESEDLARIDGVLAQ